MGALGLYQKAVTRTTLAGPTYFAGLLERFKAMMLKEREQYNKTFSVLILLTDGCIHDMVETKRLVVELSSEAVSIIIIGIGNEDFS